MLVAHILVILDACWSICYFCWFQISLPHSEQIPAHCPRCHVVLPCSLDALLTRTVAFEVSAKRRLTPCKLTWRTGILSIAGDFLESILSHAFFDRMNWVELVTASKMVLKTWWFSFPNQWPSSNSVVHAEGVRLHRCPWDAAGRYGLMATNWVLSQPTPYLPLRWRWANLYGWYISAFFVVELCWWRPFTSY